MFNPNDRVRITNNADSLHEAGKEGNVIQVVPYAEVGGLIVSPDSSANAFVAVQLDDPGFDPVSDEELFFAQVLQGVPDVLVDIMRNNRTAVIFDEDMLERVEEEEDLANAKA